MKRLLGFLLILIFPVVSFAQTGSFNGIGTPTLSSQPAYPSPGAKTTIELNDYRSASGGSTIKWFYNGNSIPDADNQRTVEVTAPPAGETATIKAVLVYGGMTETFTKELTPYNLDIILEPQTHVPTFYTGRALPSIGSTVRAIALLSKESMLGSDYIYTWRVNDTVIGNGPMRGANIVTFKMPQGSASTLSLQVSTPNGIILAKRSLSIPSVSPELHFYEINPLYGLLTRTIRGSFNLIGNGTTIRTEPYYLDSAVFNNPSLITWKINRDPATPDSNPYEISLERTGYPGDATLEFEVRSTTQLLQGARGNINLRL